MPPLVSSYYHKCPRHSTCKQSKVTGRLAPFTMNLSSGGVKPSSTFTRHSRRLARGVTSLAVFFTAGVALPDTQGMPDGYRDKTSVHSRVGPCAYFSPSLWAEKISSLPIDEQRGVFSFFLRFRPAVPQCIVGRPFLPCWYNLAWRKLMSLEC